MAAGASAVTRTLRCISPILLSAEVVHGFGRGSRQLGFPTANLKVRWDVQDEASLSADEKAVLDFVRSHDAGIYCAYGAVEGLDGKVHKVAMSVGWNPTFTDVPAKTIEPWILHNFPQDFYGHRLRLLVLGYVRPELRFESLEELIAEIKADGDFCASCLERPELADYCRDPFLLAAQPPVGVPLAAVLSSAPRLEKGSTRLLLVRHAEAQANAQGLLCGGGLDSELTPKGVLQAERLAAELADGPQLDVVGSSPLRRAAASAEAVAQRWPRAQRLVLEGLKEMAYGRLEGAKISEVKDEMAVVAQQWRQGETHEGLGGCGESPEQVAERALRTVAEALDGREGKTVLLVCHSWVIKALLATVLPEVGLAGLMSVPQRNCAVNLLDFACGQEGLKLRERFRVLGVDLALREEGRL